MFVSKAIFSFQQNLQREPMNGWFNLAVFAIQNQLHPYANQWLKNCLWMWCNWSIWLETQRPKPHATSSSPNWLSIKSWLGLTRIFRRIGARESMVSLVWINSIDKHLNLCLDFVRIISNGEPYSKYQINEAINGSLREAKRTMAVEQSQLVKKKKV